jgi:hypothetical protein
MSKNKSENGHTASFDALPVKENSFDTIGESYRIRLNHKQAAKKRTNR